MIESYDWQQHETLIIRWYKELRETGDFAHLCHSSLLPLIEFLVHVRDRVKLFLSIDAQGIAGAVWFSPVLDGADCALWMRKDKRHSLSVACDVLGCLEAGVAFYGTLISYTWQDKIAIALRKLGFKDVGVIPAFFDGHDAIIQYIKKGEFKWQGRMESLRVARREIPATLPTLPPRGIVKVGAGTTS